MGDTYVADVVNNAALTYIDPTLTEAGYAPPAPGTASAPGF